MRDAVFNGDGGRGGEVRDEVRRPEMRGKTWFAVVPAVLSVALSLVLGHPAHAQTQRLTMGATHSSSSFYAYQVAIATYLNRVLRDVNVTVQELGGASVSTQALLRGEVDLGIAVTSTDHAAVNGAKPFGTPSKSLRTLHFFAPLPLNFVVADDAGIRSLAELQGKPFNPGGRGTATEVQVEEVFRILGIAPSFYRAGGNDALDAYQDRRIVGFVKAGMHPDGHIQQAHVARPVRLLPMAQEQAESVAKAAPYFSVVGLRPGTHYGSQPVKVTTVQTAIGINTTSNLPAELGYRIIKAVFSTEGVQAAAEGYPPVAEVDLTTLTLVASVAPLHAGAVRYFEERGVKVPAHLVPPEYRK